MQTLILTDSPAPGVRRLTLNRPEKRNALSNALRGQLFDELRSADRDSDVRVIIIRGAGTCFSAGYDLTQDSSEPLPRHAAPGHVGVWPRHLVEGWFEIWDYATPVIAQVHGYCLAGGTELATACDLVYVADDATIGYPPVRTLGTPDMLWQPWLLGFRRGMEAVLTGDSMTGVEAATSGFANRAFPAAQLSEEVLAIALRLALVPAEVLALNKRMVHRAMEAQGMRTGIRATTEGQALSAHLASTRAFQKKIAGGLTAALDERDKPFGDYRTRHADTTDD